MERLLPSQKLIPLFTGTISALIGILVMWGWHTNNATIIQIQPQFAGMQYNAALCFFMAGVAMLGICKNYRLLPFILGVFIMGVSYLTLIEYVYHINLGIDQLFMHVPLIRNETSPGRMSPNGALILALIGTSILILSNFVTSKLEMKNLLFILMIVSLILLTMSFVGIFGYIVDMPETYGLGSYTRMAIHTTFSNILLSIGLISIICQKAAVNNFSFSKWLPWFVFVVVEVMTLSFWEASWAYMERNERQQNTQAAQSVKSTIKEEIESRQEALLRMSSRWNVRSGGTPYKEWSQDALNIMAHQPGYESIGWVDSSLHSRWIVPLKGHEAILDIPLIQDGSYSESIQSAMKEGKSTISPIFTLKSGHKGFLMYAPIGKGENFKGMIIGVINTGSFFEQVFNEVISDYNIAVYYHNELVYQRHPDLTQSNMHNGVSYIIKKFDWSVTSWPLPMLIEKYHSWLPNVILSVGFVIALMLSLITHLAQIAHRNANQAIEEIKTRRKAEQQLILYSNKLKKLSLIDSLTGINNRRSLSTILQDELSQLKQGDRCLSVILLDIDHFKQINDTYGHVTGDSVLQKVGSILRKNTRSTDTVARYGGEEFFIVLNNAIDRQAYEIAEKLRQLLAQHIFYCEKKKPFQITCSFGVYQVPPKVKKINEVFEVVDGALYTAKNSGRNCVVLV